MTPPRNTFDAAEDGVVETSRLQRLADIERSLKWDDDPERRKSLRREYLNLTESSHVSDRA